MTEGYIKLYRQIQDCDIWVDDSPFDRRSAWVDLLLMANHSDKEMLFDGQLITVKRGQRVTSVRRLAERWGWGKDKVSKYLTLLERFGMIEKSADSRRTLITIVNYDKFQGSDVQEQTVSRQSADTEQTPSRHRPATNKNDKNDNNDKNDKKERINNIVRLTRPTVEEVKEYCTERGNSVDPQRFVDYYDSNGWKVGKNPMKDWRAAVRTWERNSKKEDTDDTGEYADIYAQYRI